MAHAADVKTGDVVSFSERIAGARFRQTGNVTALRVVCGRMMCVVSFRDFMSGARMTTMKRPQDVRVELPTV